MDTSFEDKEFGHVEVRVNTRCVNTIFRINTAGKVTVTTPPGIGVATLREQLDRVRTRLREKGASIRRPGIIIDLNYRIDADYFKMELVRGDRERFLSRSELGKLTIVCPTHAVFEAPDLQAWLRKVIVGALRRNAQVVLPPRLYMLSQQYNLPYQSVRITTPHKRWGSCVGKRRINLSCYLMLLPEPLIDYVLLHELAHTKAMNHGADFHALMYELTGGNEAALTEELNRFQMPF
ncbi:MAG: M48 family metallopeptidase [Prevotellaceae bacterium]|jgi:predicted metal-dependent hydrolase|nr:M48 family metallopeptidase [Prevotellaceae bacterium]